MIKETYNSLGLDVYHEQLDNGLNVYLAPVKNRKNYRIEYMTRYGAEINEFVPVGETKKIKVPYGVAHFLEHKVFEQEDGEDPFSFFAKSGSDANAYTGYKKTTYLVEGTKNIEENLDYLLNYVNSPYFTDKNVEKEKGIIIQELNMYNDEPEQKVFSESNKAVFQKHPCRVDIGGTVKSVKSITKEVLYKCYNTFYQPSNMYLAIVGNFDIDKVMKVIKNNKGLNEKESNKPIKVIKTKEPLLVNKTRKEIKVNNITIPKIDLTFKSKIGLLKDEELLKFSLSLDILLHHLFANSSVFREEMLNKNLMTFMYTSANTYDDILLVDITAETKKPEKLYEEIMNNMKNTKITKEDVERIKKVMIANGVYRTDSVGAIMGTLMNQLFYYGRLIYNIVDIVKEITLDDVNEARKHIGLDNSSLIIAYPKE